MFKPFSAQLLLGSLAASILTTAPERAWSQASPPPALGLQSPSPAQSEAIPAPRDDNPGLINEIGKLFEKSKSLLPPLKSPGEAINDFNARAKDAGESLSNLARPS